MHPRLCPPNLALPNHDSQLSQLATGIGGLSFPDALPAVPCQASPAPPPQGAAGLPAGGVLPRQRGRPRGGQPPPPRRGPPVPAAGLRRTEGRARQGPPPAHVCSKQYPLWWGFLHILCIFLSECNGVHPPMSYQKNALFRLGPEFWLQLLGVIILLV